MIVLQLTRLNPVGGSKGYVNTTAMCKAFPTNPTAFNMSVVALPSTDKKIDPIRKGIRVSGFKNLALLIESMNGSKLEAQNPIITLLNHAKNVNSYPDSATPKIS